MAEPDVRVDIGSFGSLVTIEDALRTQIFVHIENAEAALHKAETEAESKDPTDEVETCIRGIKECVVALKPIATASLEVSAQIAIDRLRAALKKEDA